MSLTIRQTICRIAFLLIVVLPLCGTICFAAWQRLNYDAGGYESSAAAQLGLQLQVTTAAHPKPGTTRFTTVAILDPETHDPIAECDEIEVTSAPMAVGVRIPSARVPYAKFRTLLEVLHGRLMTQRRLMERSVFVSVDEVVLTRQNAPGINLRELRLEAEVEGGGPSANLTFRWADRPQSEPVRLHLSRNQSGDEAFTDVELLTGNSALPCSLVCEIPANLGVSEDATFQGVIRATVDESGWSTNDVAGMFANLRVADVGVPITSSSWQFALRRLSMERNWVTEIEGRLTAGSGTVDVAWLNNAAARLGFQVAEGIKSAQGKTVFSQLAVDFHMDSQTTAAHGVAGSATSRVLIQQNGKGLVAIPDGHRSKTLDVVRVLFGLENDETPLNAVRRPLLRAFPLN